MSHANLLLFYLCAACFLHHAGFIPHNTIYTMKLSAAEHRNKNTLKTQEFHPDWDTVVNTPLTAPHSSLKHADMY